MAERSHNETTAPDRRERLRAGPRVLALRRQLASPFAFIHARLSPTARLGLHLTLGVLMLIGAAWLALCLTAMHSLRRRQRAGHRG